MDDGNAIFPLTPPNGSEAEDNNEQDNANSDNESVFSFNFDAPATIAPEGALFSNPTSTPPSRMPESIRNLGILLHKRRRAAAQSAMRGGATAWIDQDDSGTYDPKRKRATPEEFPQKKVKRQRISPELNEDGNPKPRRVYKKVGYGLMVTLTLGSEKGREYLRSITPGPVESELSSEIDSDSSTDSDHDSGYGSFPKPRRRRKRQLQQPERLGASTERVDGLTIDDLTVGHPQRRGCKACFEAGDDECTLIDHKFDYPCEACRDGSVECELILKPELKKVCERCKKKRRSCSYRVDGGKGVESCQQCEEEGVKCCAGPMKESSYARRYDKPSRARRSKQDEGASSGEAEGRERMWVMCNQCRDGGKRCSLKSKQHWGPCSCCRKNHEECKFVLPPRQRQLLEAPDLSIRVKAGKKGKAGKGKAKGRRGHESPDEGGNPFSPTTHTKTLLREVGAQVVKQVRRERKKGNHHILKQTSFCHPIKFNYEPDPNNNHPCNWCDYPLFGFFGLSDDSGPRTVEGFYHDNGDGFEEIGGGYAENDISQTRMCIACTFDRLRIVGCPAHQYRKLIIGPEKGEGVDVDERVWDPDAWSAAIEACGREDKEGGRLVNEASYCSVCPDLAGFKCCAPSFSFGEEGEEEGEVEGCGLLLCEKCMEMMGKGIAAGFSRGSESLDALVGEAARARLLYPLGVRADAEFITTDGELMMRIGQGMGADGEDFDVSNSPNSPSRFTANQSYTETPKARKADKGKGKDMSFFSPPPVLNSTYPDSKGKGKEKDMGYATPTRGERGKQESPRVWIGELNGGLWMNDEVVEGKEERKMSFGGEIGSRKAKMGRKVKSTMWDKEKKVWGEVEVIELSSDDES
ncbi:hypothetical protein N431DRAFT_371182 [Stipitochalara longipes BDJ]|nr:hypothetical protein N431DRAFT_371182 [Stipitochalara longipes BDJ]